MKCRLLNSNTVVRRIIFNNINSVHAPILNIELSHVVIDELHLLLRIMDVLIGNMVKKALQWDKHDNWGGGGGLGGRPACM
jgi:hypothetical protein